MKFTHLLFAAFAAAATTLSFAGQPPTQTTMTVELPDGPALFTVKTARAGGVTTVHGRDNRGRFLVMADTGRGFRGSVVGAGERFEIEPGSLMAKRRAVSEPTLRHDLRRDVMAKPAPKAMSVQPKASPDPNETRLDVIFLYTQRAKEELGMDLIRDEIAVGMEWFNASFENSGLPYTANLVAIEQTNVEDLPEDDIGEFYVKVGQNPGNSKQLRDRFGADIFVFMRPRDPPAIYYATGVASIYDGRPIEEERELAYSVISATPLGSSSTVTGHEVGHLMGGGHEAPERGWLEYSSAHVCDLDGDPLNDYGTAIAAHIGGSSPIYSTPDVIDAEGVRCGDTNTGDNVRTIRTSFPSVSVYNPRMATPSSLALPSAPVEISETAEVVRLDVVRTGDLSNKATVEVATLPSGSSPAAPGVEYEEVTLRITLAAGVDRKAVEIPIIDNSEYGGGEKQFSVVLRYPELADVTVDEVAVTILDDDPAPIPSPSPTPTATPSEGGGGGGSMDIVLLLAFGLVSLQRGRKLIHI